MSSYTTREGDTFEIVARRVFGTEEAAGVVRAGNPGVQEPLAAGIELFVAKFPALNVTTAGAEDAVDEPILFIDGKVFRFWHSIKITRVLDGISSVEFTTPFDPSDASHRAAFKPFSYKPVVVNIGPDPLFVGTMIAVRPSESPDERTITVTAYSRPGVLHDCTMPASAFPLEFNDLKLDDIAEKMCKPFGIQVIFQEEAGAKFERIAADPGQRVFQFLTELAKQRNLIITSDVLGCLVFKRSVDPLGAIPTANLTDTEPPVQSVSSSFNQQRYYSSITGIEPVFVGLKGSQVTVQNPRLIGALRPFTFTVNSTDGADVQQVVEAKAARMFGDMASYSIMAIGWRDSVGFLWEPNTVVILTAPGAMIYKPSRFIVREVSLLRTPDQKSTLLNLVLPGSYSGQLPEVLPWD